MNYAVINKDGYKVYESDSLADVASYVNDHQEDENDPDYAYAVIDYTQQETKKGYYLELDTTDDADIITKLDSVTSKQEYMKQLIRADI